MKKILMLAGVAGLMLSSTALAQDSTLFFDIRDNSSLNQIINTPTYPYTVGALNAGRAGDAQTLYLAPHFSDGWETNTWQKNGWPNTDGDADVHTGSFWLYMDVNPSGGGGTGVISSIGLDFNVTPPATVRNTVASLAYAWDAGVFATANAGKVDGAYQASPQAWLGARAVHVPVSAGPVFDTTGGLVPTNRYKVGKLDVVAGNRACTYGAGYEANSTYTVKMAVNSLLITRAFNGTPPDTVEDVALGYAAGVPESPYAAGNVQGATSAAADATIIVEPKGDFSGDGRVLTNDTALYLAKINQVATNTQRIVFLGAFSGDRRILSNDTAAYLQQVLHSGCGPF